MVEIWQIQFNFKKNQELRVRTHFPELRILYKYIQEISRSNTLTEAASWSRHILALYKKYEVIQNSGKIINFNSCNFANAWVYVLRKRWILIDKPYRKELQLFHMSKYASQNLAQYVMNWKRVLKTSTSSSFLLTICISERMDG